MGIEAELLAARSEIGRLQDRVDRLERHLDLHVPDGRIPHLLGELGLLQLATRTASILDLADVRLVGELVLCTPEAMLELRNCGDATLRDCEIGLHSLGAGLGLQLGCELSKVEREAVRVQGIAMRQRRPPSSMVPSWRFCPSCAALMRATVHPCAASPSPKPPPEREHSCA